MNMSKPREMAGEGVECVLDRVHVQRPGGEGKPGTNWGVEVSSLWLEHKDSRGKVSDEARGVAGAGHMPAWGTWIVS